MRSIKFRVYDKQQESFVNEPYYAISLLGTLQIEGHTSVEPNRYVIQQFTGLLDKNGTEIYEGDIVRLKRYPDIQEISRVYWDDKKVCFLPFHHIIHYERWVDDFYTVEIIGNIYQNPDLIKVD